MWIWTRHQPTTRPRGSNPPQSTELFLPPSPPHSPPTLVSGSWDPVSLQYTISLSVGNSPLHHVSRKSSSQSESTPLSSPSSVQAGGPLSANPFALNYDSGNCDHWQSSTSASSSGGQSPLLVTASSVGGRENGRNAEETRRAVIFPHALEMKNNLYIETTGLPDPNQDAPSPLSPKGLQFRHRPFLSSSSSLQSPIPRSANSLVAGATPASSRSPRPPSSSLLQHDKYLSPFNSDFGPHPHGHAHTHPHSSTHRQLHRLRAHLSASSLGVPSSLPRAQPKPEIGCDPPAKSFSSRLSVHSPLSKLSVSASIDENSGAPSVREGGRGDLSGRRKRRNSELSLDQEESVMESDSSLVGSCDEGVDMVSAAKRT